MSISLVQNTSSAPGSANPTLAFSSNVSKGDILIVAVTYGVSGAPTSITDSPAIGTTFQSAGPELSANNAGSFYGQVFWGIAGGSGSDTVTINSGSNTINQIFLVEFSGPCNLDQFAKAFGAGTAVDSGGVTTRSANEALLGFYIATGSGSTHTPGSGWTALNGQGATQFGSTEYQIVSSTGTYNAKATLTTGKSGTPSWAAFIVTFTADGFATATGVSATSAENNPSATGGGNVSASGVSATSGENNPTPQAGAVPSGVSSTSAVNNPTSTSGTANVSVTGVSATSAENNPVGEGIAVPTGLSIASAFNAPSLAVVAFPTGLPMASSLGTSTGSGAGNVSVSGVSVTCAVNNPFVQVFAVIAGLVMSSAVGVATVFATWVRLAAAHFLTIVESLTALSISATSESLSVGGFTTAISMSVTGVTIAQD